MSENLNRYQRNKVWLIVHRVKGNDELCRLVTGVWSSHKGAKIAFDHYRLYRPDFDYGVACYEVYQEGEGLH